MQRLRSVDLDRRTHGVGHIAIIRVLDEAACEWPVLKVLPTFSRRPGTVPSSGSIQRPLSRGVYSHSRPIAVLRIRTQPAQERPLEVEAEYVRR